MTWMTRTAILAILVSVAAHGQLVDEFKPPRGNCCQATSAQALADALQDWNQLGRYHADNEALKKLPADPKRVVFFGDSITENWKLAESFPAKPYVNRGIGGQTTPQMLVRMFPDVIDLNPAAMILLAGTNDVARNTGPSTLTMIEENIQAIAELAKVHGIQVILCSVTPVSDYTRRPMSTGRPPADILKLNTWMKDYAGRTGVVYADYFSVLVDEKGMLKDGISADGLHPNAKGYELMAPVAEGAIQKALPR
jgi:lysophospholipase L1-like esterase